ncbi:MAG TPA: LamG-like jellyroll fold domain-containing protein, partial [Ktedonobacterales bacterium]|nr:LamG-like jellyroll fold domain-containing protein [Ktedonobacterales bacterium]
KSRVSVGGIAIISTILAALLIFGVYVGFRHLQSGGGLTRDSSTSPYTASKPGQGCDNGGATWVESADTKFTFACQPNGLLITQNGDYDLISGVGYQGSGNPLSPNYHVQVAVTIQSNEPTDTVGINVHQTKTPQNILSGGQLFSVQSSGFWSATRLSADGSTGQRLADGVIAQPSTKLTLAVDVKGAAMVFSVNGQIVTTITDATYLKTDAIALVVSNHATLPNAVTGNNPVSAVFSQFSFAPVTGTAISPTAAVATATAQTGANLGAPYKTAKPGPGCDTGKGQWAGPAFFGDSATVSCSGGLHFSIPSSSKTPVGRAGFFWLDGNFSANYSVSVQATLNQLNAGSVLLSLRVTADGRYIFSVNAQGQWTIRSADAANNYSTIDQGVAAVGSSVTIAATVKGSTITLALNGQQVASDTDSSETDTSYIALGLVGVSGQASATTFSNFTFTPMP